MCLCLVPRGQTINAIGVFRLPANLWYRGEAHAHLEASGLELYVFNFA